MCSLTEHNVTAVKTNMINAPLSVDVLAFDTFKTLWNNQKLIVVELKPAVKTFGILEIKGFRLMALIHYFIYFLRPGNNKQFSYVSSFPEL